VTPVQLSAEFLYWAGRQCPPDGQDPRHSVEGWDKGYLSLQATAQALNEKGICTYSDFPDKVWTEDMDKGVLDEAKKNKMSLAGATDQAPGERARGFRPERAGYAAEIVLQQLVKGQPVALCFPVYPTSGDSTNWNDAGLNDGTLTFPTGRGVHDHIGGHAVCIVGWVPDPGNQAAGGGHFIFRNSMPDFGRCHAIPGVTGDGYGRVSYADAQDFAWDMLTLEDATSANETIDRLIGPEAGPAGDRAEAAAPAEGSGTGTAAQPAPI